MTVDIFIKTCPKDYPWLMWCLRSIDRWTTGFRSIVVVADQPLAAVAVAAQRLVVYWCYAPPPSLADIGGHPGTFPHGVGYAWQQGIKLLWTRFTDADAVAIFDSDFVLRRPLSPEMFLHRGRPALWHRPWSEAGNGIIHKPAADHFIHGDSPFDFMPGPCLYATREATEGLQDYMRLIWHQTPTEYMLDPRHPPPSEYNLFGAYLHEKSLDRAHHGYDFIRPIADWPIRQFWSWGGITASLLSDLEAAVR